MDKEIWKDIVGYEGIYQVSNLGRIKSLEKEVWNRYQFIKKEEKILKYGNTPKGYYVVKLYKNNTHCNKKIHRLVAEAFISNPNNLPQVNHIDGNKKNNNVNNLEWCSNKENQIHAWEHNLQTKKYGANNKLSKKVKQYDLRGNFIKMWNCVEEARKTLHISNISSVCNGKRNNAGGYIWRYVND